MPRATSNFTVKHPPTCPFELGREYDHELRTMLGRDLPGDFKHRLKHLLGLCRQRILRKVPTKADGELALDELAKTLRQAVHQLGHAGDAAAGPLARVRRQLSGGVRELRQRQADIEDLMQRVEQARYTAPRHDLSMDEHNAKVSLAAGLAELLEVGCGIPPTTTMDSPYLQLVEWALDHVAPKRPGDPKGIAAKGLRAWRDR